MPKRRTLHDAVQAHGSLTPVARVEVQMRARTPAHLDAAEPWRCADVPVRIPAWHKDQCGPGGPRTSTPPNPGGARTSSSAFRPGTRFIAGGDARAPRRRRTPGGARTSSSAFRPGTRFNAGEDPRVPSRLGNRACAAAASWRGRRSPGRCGSRCCRIRACRAAIRVRSSPSTGSARNCGTWRRRRPSGPR